MEFKEVIVAKVKDLQDGEMKQVSVEGGEILLVKTDGKISALGAYCTHYGAELQNGIVSEGRIVCPWHQASFCARSGDVKEPPALNALPRYEVTIQGEDVVVKLPEKLKRSRVPEMVSYDPESDSRTFVILGAGAAGNAAAQTLREDGFKGRILLITHEPHRPYDRPNLDKAYLQGEADEKWMPLRTEKFYQHRGIDLMLGRKVTNVDVTTKTITFEDHENLTYDKLLLATGSIPRQLNVPGEELQNIFTLRSFDDSNAIINACKHASRVAVVGASFIGLETACSLRERGLQVTVIAPEEVPFEHIFGKEIGTLIRQLHENSGTTCKLGTTVEKLEGKDKVEAVVLKNGERVEADVVIIGIGVKPNTDFLQGVEKESDGSLKVNTYFQGTKDVYAVGDLARFPDWRTSGGIRIEHWRTAEQHGRDAAHNMTGKIVANESVPFFWTKQVDVNIRYVGHVQHWDEIIIDGDVASKRFIAFYIKKNQVYAAAGCKRDKEMAAIHELMRLKNMPTPDELRGKSVDLLGLIT